MEDKEPKQRIYEDLGLEGAGVSYESFSKKFDSDPEARKSVYKDLGLEQAGVDYQTFETKMFGEKKNPIGNDLPTGGKVGASEIPSIGNETAELLGYKKPIQAPSPLIKQPDIAATPPTQQTKVIGEVVDNKNKIIATKTLTNLDEKQTIQPKVGVDKTTLEDYNRTYDIYKNRDKWMSMAIQNDVLNHYVTSGGVLGDIVNVASGVISAPNYKKAEEDFKKTPAYAKLYGIKKKAENEFYAAKAKADKEVEAQSENIANQLGGWGKIVTENGNADVDKIREGVDSFLDKNGIPTDSPIAYKLRNEIKGKAEFKRIEPEIETQFDVEYKKAFGVTPEQDIQKEYGVQIEQAKTIKEAKIALEKQRAVQNEALKNEYKPEYEALGGQYKAKTEELNLAIENDPELNSFAQSLNNDVFQKYQAAVDGGQMTAEQANQEMNSPKNQDAVKAEVLKKVNEKYGKQYESAFTEYQKQINEVATRYNLAHRQQEERRVSEANQKIQAEVEKLKGQFKVSNELIERRKKAYSKAYKNVSEKQNLAKEAAGRSLNFTTQAGLSLLMGLGGGLKGYGAEFDNKTLYDIGESLESNFDIRVGESKDFSDWLDSSKLTVGTGNIIGRMVPGIALTAGAAALTKDWNLTSRLATTAVTGWAAETADMAGTIKNDVLEKTGDPAKADKAARDMWRSQTYILPLYALEGAPFIGEFYTQIGKKIAPKLFAEAAKGSRKTFGQWAKEAAAKSVGAGTAEVVTETLQEFPQNINEEAIRNGKEIGNIADQIDVYSEGASLKGLKETFVQIAPSTFLMGGTPVFVSDVYNGAKQKYYEKAVDNYVNSESISASLETSPEQYLFNVTADKGSNFAGTLLNTLYTSGKISEVEFDNLSQKMANMDAFNKLSKKAGMKEDKTSSLVGYRLYDQYLTANESFEQEKDPIAKEVLKAKANESKKNLTEYLQGSGVNVGIMTLANGQQFVFTPEELKFALQFENIRNSIKNGEIGLTITAKKGEENQSKQTIDELNEMLKEPVSVSEEIKKPVVEREEVVTPTVTLNKNTTPTEEKYGTIDRGDGKGIVDLTRAEYEAEMGKMDGLLPQSEPKRLVPIDFNKEYISEGIDSQRQFLEKEILSETEYLKERESKKGRIEKVLDRLSGVTYDDYLKKQQNRLSLLNKDPLAYFEKELADEKKWQKKHPDDANEGYMAFVGEMIDNLKNQTKLQPTAPIISETPESATMQGETVTEGTVTDGEVSEGAYNYQDKNAEPLISKSGTHKGFSFKWNNDEWRYRFENAGDIIRELTKYKDGNFDLNYIYEKVNALESFFKRNPNFSETEQDAQIIEKLKREYEKLPTNSEAQAEAKKLILNLLNGNIDEAKSQIEYFDKFRDDNAYVNLKQANTAPSPTATIEPTATEEEKGESTVPSKTDKAYQEAQGVTERISKAHPEASVLILPKGDDLLLTALYVGKEKRGKGIGSGVLESVKAEADKLGKKVVLDATNELDSETDLERLGNFYEKNGFVKVGENKFEYTPKETPQAGSVGVGGEVTFQGKRGQADSITFDGKTIKQGEEIELNDVNISQDDSMPDLRSGKYKVRMLSVDANGKTATLTLTDGNEVITTTVKDLRKSEQSLQSTPQATENEKITQEENGQPLPEGVSGVRTETEERKTSAELRAEEKEVRSTIDNAVANFYAINEATKRSEKREAAKEFRQNLEKMPTVKNVFDNIKSIFAQLEAEGIITKSKDCP